MNLEPEGDEDCMIGGDFEGKGRGCLVACVEDERCLKKGDVRVKLKG